MTEHLYNAIMTLIAIALMVTGILFAIDREIARRDSVKNPDGQIIGCIWEINCNYYNKE